MKTVVVYESMFGNTRSIANAIAEGLVGAGEVVVGSVDDLSPHEVGDAGLLVAGGPTHGHGMARPTAHQAMAKDESYAKYGPVLEGEESLRGWLERLPAGRAAAAAFDTRFASPGGLPGRPPPRSPSGCATRATRSSGPSASSSRPAAAPWPTANANAPPPGVAR